MKSRILQFCGSFSLLVILLGGSPFALFSQQNSAQSAKALFPGIRFETSQNLIFVSTKVNNSEPLGFILDSGASLSVINEKTARALGFKFGGKNKINALGGMIEYSRVKNINFDVSGAKLSNQTIAAIDLSVLEPKLGRKIDGILGGEFFNRYVVEIDYAAQTLNLYDPQNFRYSGAGEVIDLEIEANTPFIRADLSPNGVDFIDGKFLVDTGAISSLYVNKRFAEQYDFLQVVEETIPELFTAQLGGEIAGRVGRMKKMRVGNFTLENAVTHFPIETGGAGSSSTSTRDGIIGASFFRKFTVILDYGRRQLILQPNKHFSAPFESDRSGLELIAVGADFKRIKARKVLANSPASEAGLQVEDVFISIDGKTTDELNLDAIEEMLRQPEREYDLTVLRGGEPLKTKIKLRHLF